MARRQLGQALQHGAACEPFRRHLEQAAAADSPARRWSDVEEGFLDAMAAFDAEVTVGRATEGERQNGKGDYFNELVAAVIEAACGARLERRKGVHGLVFPDYNLDVTYPADGVAEILVEVKALGTPKHPGNPNADPRGRRASADLPKRLREAAFKTIDLKAGFGYQQAGEPQPGPTGSLTTWLRRARPLAYLLIAARVTGESDLQRVVSDSENLTKVMDGVGVFCFGADDSSATNPSYAACSVPASIDLGRTMHDIAEQVRHLSS